MTFDRLEDDGDLRRRFAVLRTEEARAAPAFRVPAGGRRRRHPVPIWIGTAAAMALVIAGGVWLSTGGPERRKPELLDLTQTRWTSPTEFLLETPGGALLHEPPPLLDPATLPGLDFTIDQPDPPSSETLS
jgi:hypothetical protein